MSGEEGGRNCEATVAAKTNFAKSDYDLKTEAAVYNGQNGINHAKSDTQQGGFKNGYNTLRSEGNNTRNAMCSDKSDYGEKNEEPAIVAFQKVAPQHSYRGAAKGINDYSTRTEGNDYANQSSGDNGNDYNGTRTPGNNNDYNGARNAGSNNDYRDGIFLVVVMVMSWVNK